MKRYEKQKIKNNQKTNREKRKKKPSGSFQN